MEATAVVETTAAEIIEEEDTRLYFILLQNHLNRGGFLFFIVFEANGPGFLAIHIPVFAFSPPLPRGSYRLNRGWEAGVFCVC